MRRRFLTRVVIERVKRGLVAGVIAAAATAGVLLGLGRARGATFTLLNDSAHLLVGARARIVENANVVVTGLAMLVHVLSVLIWGVVFALMVGSLRGWRLLAAAFAFTGMVVVIDLWVLPTSVRPGFETDMSVGELALLYVVLGVALWLGVREGDRSAPLA